MQSANRKIPNLMPQTRHSENPVSWLGRANTPPPTQNSCSKNVCLNVMCVAIDEKCVLSFHFKC